MVFLLALFPNKEGMIVAVSETVFGLGNSLGEFLTIGLQNSSALHRGISGDFSPMIGLF